jgi:hypothetical protein
MQTVSAAVIAGGELEEVDASHGEQWRRWLATLPHTPLPRHLCHKRPSGDECSLVEVNVMKNIAQNVD